LSFSIISYWDLIKLPYFVNTTEKGDRGWKQGQRQGGQGDFRNNSIDLKMNCKCHCCVRRLTLKMTLYKSSFTMLLWAPIWYEMWQNKGVCIMEIIECSGSCLQMC
jgi:hypothetical protein